MIERLLEERGGGGSEYASLRHMLNLVEMRILKHFFQIPHLCVGTWPNQALGSYALHA